MTHEQKDVVAEAREEAARHGIELRIVQGRRSELWQYKAADDGTLLVEWNPFACLGLAPGATSWRAALELACERLEKRNTTEEP